MLFAACGPADPAVPGALVAPPSQAHLLDENALNQNALNQNALSLNALNQNALTLQSLSGASLSAIQAPNDTGQLARQLLQYTVSCAFTPTQTFSFSWIDASGVAHQERYPGLLGLASGWATRPLTASEERWISACLIARVNWYGVHVSISSRGPFNSLLISRTEADAYQVMEGVFYGDLFAPSPTAYACYNSQNVSHSRELYRDCAAGHLTPEGATVDCGIIRRVGDCSNLCAGEKNSKGYFTSCTLPGGALVTEVITTYLQ
jgi:hypothetical protein